MFYLIPQLSSNIFSMLSIALSLSVSFPPTDIFCHANIINFELSNINAWLSANKSLINDTESNYLFFFMGIFTIYYPSKLKLDLSRSSPQIVQNFLSFLSNEI